MLLNILMLLKLYYTTELKKIATFILGGWCSLSINMGDNYISVKTVTESNMLIFALFKREI